MHTRLASLGPAGGVILFFRYMVSYEVDKINLSWVNKCLNLSQSRLHLHQLPPFRQLQLRTSDASRGG